MNNILLRLKSKTTIISILSIVFVIAGHFNLYSKLGITEEQTKLTIDTILGVLVSLGILNNPTDKNNF
jgi:uncharacterized membrane protein